MSESTTTAAIYDESSKYWKMCTAVLGVGFVIAVASHGGPASASANNGGFVGPNLLTQHQSDVAYQAQQDLSIGGFDAIDGSPVFVIVNQDGLRVGTLPMTAISDE